MSMAVSGRNLSAVGVVTLILAGWLALAPRGYADETIRVTCPVVADTTIAAVQRGDERNVNAGGVDRLWVRSNETFALLACDLGQLAGMEVTKATLRVRRVETLLVRVGVSTIAAPWKEGTAAEPSVQEGGACFSAAAYSADRKRLRWWAGAGSTFADVIFGSGGSRWVPRVARYDMETKWYEIDVPPEFVQAALQGLQPGGLCISDDFGRMETNPTIWSRESSFPPELIVEARRTAPGESQPPRDVQALRDKLGLEWVTFAAPHALGFEIYVSERPLANEADLAAARRLPIWALPTPGSGQLRAMLSLHRGSEPKYVAVRAMEAAAEWSELVCTELPAPLLANPSFSAPKLERHDLPTTFSGPFTLDDGPSLSLDGRWIRNAGKTWWDPQRGPIALQAGRNEFAAFQVVLAGGPGRYAVTLAEWNSPGLAEPAPRVQLFRQEYVKARLGREKYAPDVAVPLLAGEPLQLDLLTPQQAAQPTSQPVKQAVTQGVWVDVYVPHQAARGVWRTRVVALRDGVALLDVPLELEVVDVALPDQLGFKLSLNSAVTPGRAYEMLPDSPEAWEAWERCHRLAHEHRATLSVVPYTSAGEVLPGFAPQLTQRDGEYQLDWGAWDRRFGGLFDGSTFRDLPRAGVPVEHFCLPFHESWPMPFEFKRQVAHSPLAGKYHHRTTRTEPRRNKPLNPPLDAYMVWPIEEAFGEDYTAGTVAVLRAVARHVGERGWDQTAFHLHLANRFYGRQSSSWWMLDDPQIHDDFLALRFWLRMYRQALEGDSPAEFRLRVANSAPQSQRDTLDGLVDISVMSAGVFDQSYALLNAPQRFGDVWSRGWDLRPEYGWANAYKWGWAARFAGARGLLTDGALGSAESWEKAATWALLYPERTAAAPRPLASLRLKALRRVQQDMELLHLWLARGGAQDKPEGYGLAVVARELILRTQSRTPDWATLLPIVRFPGRLDTVAFEEIRRGLRAGLQD
ncbi:MAG: hypothetical protein KKB50_13125 [Planctomycetes bacterium]|nr:hypothetical protein [Planctomycetota bacterium]